MPACFPFLRSAVNVISKPCKSSRITPLLRSCQNSQQISSANQNPVLARFNFLRAFVCFDIQNTPFDSSINASWSVSFLLALLPGKFLKDGDGRFLGLIQVAKVLHMGTRIWVPSNSFIPLAIAWRHRYKADDINSYSCPPTFLCRSPLLEFLQI
ncbi:hypothetical protein BDP27DRAFT_157300 [Rhodocollybia butyracea]|uniref:Uncharacterized protein n=1 Tax=Rhodocollybia butyracea TaxID=206335 RepID=A0A9P5PJN0_9AGAR|nr:hypothetical protein BDP27DRAFT_157300 [Rhodocollybia butyracea]